MRVRAIVRILLRNFRDEVIAGDDVVFDKNAEQRSCQSWRLP